MINYKVDEQDCETLRGFFIWCSANNITLKNDYTDFIKFNNL